jgi:NAD(P)-dependent dehydrogenase (short-subunit alcohol dehydrogenase family)
MDLKLKGKRALVTGASKGIGRACVEMLVSEGCTVLGVSRSIAPGPHSKAADLSQRGVAEEVAAWAGEIDILVNNAGAIPGGDLLKVDEETWRKAWDLKVFGYINLTRAVYAGMKRRGRGAIVNVIGAAGEKMNAAYITGSTGNAGLMAFTRALGGASHADGIRVVGINPGPVATDRLISLHKQMAQTKLGDASRYEELFKDMSFGRPATAEEIASAVAFFASERSGYTSGTILTIDGGQSNRA